MRGPFSSVVCPLLFRDYFEALGLWASCPGWTAAANPRGPEQYGSGHSSGRLGWTPPSHLSHLSHLGWCARVGQRDIATSMPVPLSPRQPLPLAFFLEWLRNVHRAISVVRYALCVGWRGADSEKKISRYGIICAIEHRYRAHTIYRHTSLLHVPDHVLSPSASRVPQYLQGVRLGPCYRIPAPCPPAHPHSPLRRVPPLQPALKEDSLVLMATQIPKTLRGDACQGHLVRQALLPAGGLRPGRGLVAIVWDRDAARLASPPTHAGTL